MVGEDLLEVRAGVEKEEVNTYTDLVSVKVVKVKTHGQFFFSNHHSLDTKWTSCQCALEKQVFSRFVVHCS